MEFVQSLLILNFFYVWLFLSLFCSFFGDFLFVSAVPAIFQLFRSTFELFHYLSQ